MLQTQRIPQTKINVFKFTALVRAFINFVVVNNDDGDMEPFTLRCVY